MSKTKETPILFHNLVNFQFMRFCLTKLVISVIFAIICRYDVTLSKRVVLSFSLLTSAKLKLILKGFDKISCKNLDISQGLSIE